MCRGGSGGGWLSWASWQTSWRRLHLNRGRGWGEGSAAAEAGCAVAPGKASAGRGLALGARAESVLVLVTFKLCLIPEVTSAVGRISVGKAWGEGSLGGRPVWLGPRSAAGTPPGTLSWLLPLVPGTPALAAGRASARGSAGLSWPGLALAWESEPRLEGPLGALEKQRRFLLHFS